MENIEGYIHNLLNVYTPETRFLQNFRLEDSIGHADFKVNSEFYSSNEEMSHLTAVQMQICINQLLFVYISALGKYDKFFSGQHSDMAYINEFQNNNTFITCQAYYFHKRIDTSGLISAKMWLKKEKMIGNLLIMDVEFDFSHRSSSGDVRIAIKNED